jgi:hypothetical protein
MCNFGIISINPFIFHSGKLSGIKGGIGRLRVAGGGVEDGEELKPAGKKHFNRNKREKLRRVFVATSY